MATFIADVGENLALYKVHVDEIKEQDVNARVMPPEMLERLSDTVKRENRLEQLPFTVKREGYFELVSGHHRLRAARAANLTEIFVLADTRDLSRSAVVAKQLSHNRIGGDDNKEVLAKLYAEMDQVQDILESYVKPSDFDDIRQLQPSDITSMSMLIEWRHVSLVFLPKAMENLEKLEAWAAKVDKEADHIGIVDAAVFEKFRQVSLAIGRTANVRAMGHVVSKMLEICVEFLETNKIPLIEPEEDPIEAAKAKAKNPAFRAQVEKKALPPPKAAKAPKADKATGASGRNNGTGTDKGDEGAPAP